MYDFAGKNFADMTVAELRSFLAQPEISKFVDETFNTKTRKGELVGIAERAHGKFIKSDDFDQARSAILSETEETVTTDDVTIVDVDGESWGITSTGKMINPDAVKPISLSHRMTNYAKQQLCQGRKWTNQDNGHGYYGTPRQIRRAMKKANRAQKAMLSKVDTAGYFKPYPYSAY